MTGKQMIKEFERNGWKLIRISKSSHYHFEKNGHRATVPHHTQELGKGIQEKLLKQLREVR